MKMVTRLDPMTGRMVFLSKNTSTGIFTPCPLAGDKAMDSSRSKGSSSVSGPGSASSTSSSALALNSLTAAKRKEIEGTNHGDGEQDESKESNSKRKSYSRAPWMDNVVSSGSLDLPKLKVPGPVHHKDTSCPLGKELRSLIKGWWERTEVRLLCCDDSM